MMKSALVSAAAAAMAQAGGVMNPTQLLKTREHFEGTLGAADAASRKGRGHGKQPRHASKRFVAQDKRNARRARNRR